MAVIDCACCNKLFHVIFQSFKTREKGHYWCCQSPWYTLFRILHIFDWACLYPKFWKNDIVSRTEFFHSQFTPKKLCHSIDRSLGAPILEKNGGKKSLTVRGRRLGYCVTGVCHYMIMALTNHPLFLSMVMKLVDPYKIEFDLFPSNKWWLAFCASG